MKPCGLALPRSATLNTARLLLSALATNSTWPSGVRHRPLGVFPGGEEGATARVDVHAADDELVGLLGDAELLVAGQPAAVEAEGVDDLVLAAAGEQPPAVGRPAQSVVGLIDAGPRHDAGVRGVEV